SMLSHNFAFLAILKRGPRMDDRELLTVSQAAEALSATAQSIRNWIRAGRLSAVRIGNRFLIPREEVERLLGDVSPARGESLWAYDVDRPPDPLPRKAQGREPSTDPADG